MNGQPQSLKSRVQSPGPRVKAEVKSKRPDDRRPAAVDYLSLPLRLARAGAAGDRLRRPSPPQGRQGRHNAQAGGCHRADPGSRREPSPGHEADPGDRESAHLHRARRLASRAVPGRPCRASPTSGPPQYQLATLSSRPSTLNPQLSTLNHLHAQRPDARGRARGDPRRTELGAAQKDTARELGAKLASLKGIVWVGVGLFVFGLASLVWPPLKVVIGERDDQRRADARRSGPHGPAQPDRRQ